MVTSDTDDRLRLFLIGLVMGGVLLPFAVVCYRAWTDKHRYADGVVVVVGADGVRLAGPDTLVSWSRLREVVVFRLFDYSGEAPVLCWFLVLVEPGRSTSRTGPCRDPRTWGASRELPRRPNLRALTAAVARHSSARVRDLGTIEDVRADLPIGTGDAADPRVPSSRPRTRAAGQA